MCNFSSKSNEPLVLGAICPNIGSELYSTPSKYLEWKFSSRPIYLNLDFNGL